VPDALNRLFALFQSEGLSSGAVYRAIVAGCAGAEAELARRAIRRKT
jgi:hypothetical protein